MNYGNRNASSEYTVSDLQRGYFGAVAVSVSIALGSRILLKKALANAKGARFLVMNAFLNYLAAAFAGAANLALMRFKETKEGVVVQNEKGDESFGKSVIAGKQAIYETALSRFILPFPVIFFPALTFSLLAKLKMVPKNSVAAKLLEASLCILSLTVSLPASVALFKQRAEVEAKDLEESFWDVKNTDGEKMERFYFNKGL